MTIAPDRVREIFQGLESGDGDGFFAHVADDVDWTVMGTHPLAGHYRSKADFIAGTFAKLGRALPEGAQLHVEHMVVKDEVVVELRSWATATPLSERSSFVCAPISTRRWWPACSKRTRSPKRLPGL
jgi:ketosteroid isomerase-like protein